MCKIWVHARLVGFSFFFFLFCHWKSPTGGTALPLWARRLFEDLLVGWELSQLLMKWLGHVCRVYFFFNVKHMGLEIIARKRLKFIWEVPYLQRLMVLTQHLWCYGLPVSSGLLSILGKVGGGEVEVLVYTLWRIFLKGSRHLILVKTGKPEQPIFPLLLNLYL